MYNQRSDSFISRLTLQNENILEQVIKSLLCGSGRVSQDCIIYHRQLALGVFLRSTFILSSRCLETLDISSDSLLICVHIVVDITKLLQTTTILCRYMQLYLFLHFVSCREKVIIHAVLHQLRRKSSLRSTRNSQSPYTFQPLPNTYQFTPTTTHHT